MVNEFFPPTESELQQMIQTLKTQLEDNHYKEDWVKLYEELEYYKNQLKQLIQNK